MNSVQAAGLDVEPIDLRPINEVGEVISTPDNHSDDDNAAREVPAFIDYLPWAP